MPLCAWHSFSSWAERAGSDRYYLVRFAVHLPADLSHLLWPAASVPAPAGHDVLDLSVAVLLVTGRFAAEHLQYIRKLEQAS
jgi:hypothetical protein